ncbi:MAG TPA: lysophospholipid acyltransferase family protein, partial [bacterium]|nr:lysophospholipid acyltransferase family protein [bacterium]
LKILPAAPSDEDVHQIVRNAFRQASAVFVETFCFPRITPGNIDGWMRLHGQDHIHEALGKGRGAILVLVHFGANQMVMAALGHRGYRIHQIGSLPDDWHRLSGTRPSCFDRKIFQMRLSLEQSLPAEFVYIDRSMRPVYNCLKHNEIMLLAADGRAGTRFLQTTMCGRTMNLSAGPFRIAHATGAPLLPVFPVRDTDGVHDLYIESPVDPETDDSSGAWPEQAASVYGRRLTEWVRSFPDHYVMLMAEAAIRSRIDPVPLFEDIRNE